MITLSQLKTKSISSVSTLMGIGIVRLKGRTGYGASSSNVHGGTMYNVRSQKQEYFLTDDSGTIVGFLGNTRKELTRSIASCFELEELGTTKVPNEEEAKNFMEPLFDLDSIQKYYRPDLTGHESICDYIRECYRETLIGTKSNEL